MLTQPFDVERSPQCARQVLRT